MINRSASRRFSETEEASNRRDFQHIFNIFGYNIDILNSTLYSIKYKMLYYL